ncbi:MAG: Ig-like domain repeat protein [Labedaea sp.]
MFATVHFIATVHGSGTHPTGTVSFVTSPDVGGCPPADVADSGTADATASCDIFVNPGQLITVNVSYSGDAAYTAATGSGTYQADKRTTSMYVSPNGPGPSGRVDFKATVYGGTEAATGTVTFTTDGPPGCANLPISGSPTGATCPISLNPGQPVTVTANYSGDATHAAAVSTTTYQALLMPTVTVLPTGSGLPGTITFTATVTASGTPPTGQVVFSADGVITCPNGDLFDGVATCAIPVTAGQTVTVTAAYSGDAYYQPVTTEITYRGWLTPTIAVAPTGVGSPGSITFTATVTGATPSPTGSVKFTTDGPAGCPAAPLAGSPAKATCAIAVNPGQQVTVTAEYLGDVAYKPVTGTTGYQARLLPTVTVRSPQVTGQGPPGNINFTATVSGTGVAPTGTVTFTASGGLTGCASVALVPGASATSTAPCQVSIPSDTSVVVTATYAGDTSFVPGYAPGVPASTVYQTPTATVSVAVSAPPGSPSGLVPFTATVTSSDGQTPVGTVTISLVTRAVLAISTFAGNSCSAILQPGPGVGQASGTCALAVAAGANLSVTAAYNGSGHNYIGTTAAAYKGKRTAVMSLAASPSAPVAPGTSVTLTAQVAGDGSGIAPTGTVRFDAAGTAVSGCASVPVSSGRAVCTTTALPVGAPRIVASYSGDAEYQPGTAEVASYPVSAEVMASAAGTGTGTELPVTGANVNGLLIEALLLILVGGAVVALSFPKPAAIIRRVSARHRASG